MQRSADQNEAWSKFIEWVSIGEKQEFRLGGLAGTGKTTLVRSMRQQMGNCEVIAPTAKAAEVLTKKGVPAKTCHSLLCRFEYEEEDEKGKSVPVFSDKRVTKDFLIVDEASMITEDMRLKILRCASRVVWVGDYGQLPPVETRKNSQGIMSENLLDAKLTEQHRHKEANEIIEFAMFLRNGGLAENWGNKSGTVSVNPQGVESFEDVVRFTIEKQFWPVICYRNIFIEAFNKKAREICGITKQIQAGLKIVCIKNNFTHRVVNGEMFTVASVEPDYIVTECGRIFPVTFDSKNTRSVLVQDGYAVTCHKAQGSEWPSIAVIEDMRACSKWRYTAATRAKQNLVYFTNDSEA